MCFGSCALCTVNSVFCLPQEWGLWTTEIFKLHCCLWNFPLKSQPDSLNCLVIGKESVIFSYVSRNRYLDRASLVRCSSSSCSSPSLQQERSKHVSSRKDLISSSFSEITRYLQREKKNQKAISVGTYILKCHKHNAVISSKYLCEKWQTLASCPNDLFMCSLHTTHLSSQSFPWTNVMVLLSFKILD